MKLLRKHIFQLALFLFAFSVLCRFTFDPDLGWHLRMGRDFLSSGQLVVEDKYSWTMEGYEWGNYFFLYQILTTVLFENFGHLAAPFLFGLLAAGAVLILTTSKLDLYKAIICVLGIIVSIGNLGVRPSTISLFFFAILLVLVEKGAYKKPQFVPFWFALFALWVNFHQGFLVALLVLAALVALDIVKTRRAKLRTNIWSIVSLVFAVLATRLTPYGGSLVSSIALDLTGIKTYTSIAEWQPAARFLPSGLFLALTGAIFIYIFLKRFRDEPNVFFLIAAFTFIFSFFISNLLVFWTAIFIFITSRYFDFKPNLKFDRLSSFVLNLCAFLILLIFPLRLVNELIVSGDFENRLVMDSYPVEAVKFLENDDLVDNVYNEYGWGGYIDFAAGDIKVFIDGRMTGWRDENTYILSDYIAISRDQCSPMAKYDIKVALVFAAEEKKCFSGWPVKYEDKIAKVLIKPE